MRNIYCSECHGWMHAELCSETSKSITPTLLWRVATLILIVQQFRPRGFPSLRFIFQTVFSCILKKSRAIVAAGDEVPILALSFGSMRDGSSRCCRSCSREIVWDTTLLSRCKYEPEVKRCCSNCSIISRNPAVLPLLHQWS